MSETKINYSTSFQLVSLDMLSASSSYSIDLRPYIVELNYFEDIFSPTVSAQLVLSEAVGFLSNFRINGTEFVKISFRKYEGDQATITKTLRVYKISHRKMDSSFGYESFVLNLCSEEMLLSEQYRISKSYKGKDIKYIIDSILTDYLKVKKNKYIDSTNGVYDFILPNKKIFETISWLSNYAQPKDGVGADMLFFENSNGYQFHSLQTLYKQKSFTKYFYNPKNANLNENVGSKIKNAFSYEILQHFDVLGGISDGTFTNRLITLDPLTKGVQIKDFDYGRYNGQKLNPYAVIPTYRDRLGKALNESPENVKLGLQSGTLRMATSNSQQKKKVLDPDGVANDIMIEKFMPNRVAQLSLANYIRLKIRVPGNNELVAGMTIDFSVPSTLPTNETNAAEKEDPIISGKYLITSVRHMIKVGTPSVFETILEVCKDSISGPLPSVPYSGNYKNAIDGIEK